MKVYYTVMKLTENSLGVEQCTGQKEIYMYEILDDEIHTIGHFITDTNTVSEDEVNIYLKVIITDIPEEGIELTEL